MSDKPIPTYTDFHEHMGLCQDVTIQLAEHFPQRANSKPLPDETLNFIRDLIARSESLIYALHMDQIEIPFHDIKKEYLIDEMHQSIKGLDAWLPPKQRFTP